LQVEWKVKIPSINHLPLLTALDIKLPARMLGIWWQTKDNCLSGIETSQQVEKIGHHPKKRINQDQDQHPSSHKVEDLCHLSSQYEIGLMLLHRVKIRTGHSAHPRNPPLAQYNHHL
jgi:hypothetical protein